MTRYTTFMSLLMLGCAALLPARTIELIYVETTANNRQIVLKDNLSIFETEFFHVKYALKGNNLQLWIYNNSPQEIRLFGHQLDFVDLENTSIRKQIDFKNGDDRHRRLIIKEKQKMLTSWTIQEKLLGQDRSVKIGLIVPLKVGDNFHQYTFWFRIDTEQ